MKKKKKNECIKESKRLFKLTIFTVQSKIKQALYFVWNSERDE